MKAVYSAEVMQALKDMPVAFPSERDRDNYVIEHANIFMCKYKTHKTNLPVEFDTLENARKCAKFSAEVGGKNGAVKDKGIVVIAVLGDREAVVETHFPAKHNGAAAP